MVSAQARREQVDFAVGRGATVRRACALLQVSRSALRYVSTMPKRDAELAEELKRISREHAVYGYRFAWALIRRGGWTVNKKRVRRLWRALGARLGERCVCYHQRDSACRLPGTSSVFGRLTNEEPAGPFDPCGQPSTHLSRRYAHLDGHDVPVEALAAALQEAVPLPAP